MGVLEKVIQNLKTAGFRADLAFPGQQFPTIHSTVAAVHLGKVENNRVTVEVCIVGPGASGGGTCEAEALKATRALGQMGADCVQGPCRYDGVSQVYVVQIQAAFEGIRGWETIVAYPGLRVKIEEEYLKHPGKFTAEQKKHPVLSMGSDEPVSCVPGAWKFTLEEMLPAEEPEAPACTEPFRMSVERNGIREQYVRCRWQTIRREFTDEGLRQIRTGVAGDRILMERNHGTSEIQEL